MTPPFGFTKAGRRELFVSLFLVPFVLIALFLGWGVLYEWRASRAVDGYAVDLGQTRGRVLVSGTVTRGELLTSPLGRQGVGWVGAVGYMASDKHGNTHFEPVCVRGELSELRIVGPIAERSLTFVEPSDPVVLGSHRLISDALPIVDVGDPVRNAAPVAIPDVMNKQCGRALAQTTNPLSYREAQLPQGAAVELLGCADGAKKVARCDDGGPYLLTTASVGNVKATAHQSASNLVVFACFWNATIMTIVALTLSSRLVRSKATLKEVLRTV